MSFECKYLCGANFTNARNCNRHEKEICDLNSNKVTPKQKNKKVSKRTLQESRNQTKKTMTEVMKEALMPFLKQIDELAKKNIELEQRLEKTLDERPNITINNTLIYNCFDPNMIDIFKTQLAQNGPEKAISYSTGLLKGKTKNNKHDWIREPGLIDMKALSHVVSYDSKSRDPGFNILEADQKLIRDPDGSRVDKILTEIVVNAGLSAQSYVARKASEAYENGNEDGMWSHLTNGSIYDNRKQTTYDHIGKYQKLVASKAHLIDIFSGNEND